MGLGNYSGVCITVVPEHIFERYGKEKTLKNNNNNVQKKKILPKITLKVGIAADISVPVPIVTKLFCIIHFVICI